MAPGTGGERAGNAAKALQNLPGAFEALPSNGPAAAAALLSPSPAAENARLRLPVHRVVSTDTTAMGTAAHGCSEPWL